MARIDYPENLYLSPAFAIKRFRALQKKYGNESALTKSEFKPEREMWASAVFLLGISQIMQKEYWLRPNKEDTSPDIFAFSLKKTEKGIIQEVLNIEVFDYEEHTQIDLVKAIGRKLRNKKYPDYFVLLCYCRKEIKGLIPLDISKEVKKMNPQIAEIWILFFYFSGEAELNTVILKAFPELYLEEYNYEKLYNSSNQKDMVRAKRDLRKKTIDIEFKYLGKYRLPLP